MLKRFVSSFFKFRGEENLKEVMKSSQATNESVPSSCLAAERMFENLQKPSFFFQGDLILYIIINIIFVPLTAVLNALVMIAVKTKSRLRAQKSNIVLAMLALTDCFCRNTGAAHLNGRDDICLASGKRLPVRCHSNWFHSSRKLLVH